MVSGFQIEHHRIRHFCHLTKFWIEEVGSQVREHQGERNTWSKALVARKNLGRGGWWLLHEMGRGKG